MLLCYYVTMYIRLQKYYVTRYIKQWICCKKLSNKIINAFERDMFRLRIKIII